MIDPEAIENWLSRDIRDSANVKRFTPEALQAKIDRLEPRPTFVVEPYPHQMACFLLGVKYPGYFFQLDMGLGKTKITLDLLRWRKVRGDVSRALVLVPGVSNIDAWGREIEKHAPDLRYHLLGEDISSKRRGEMFTDLDIDIVVVTYQGFLRLVCERAAGKGKLLPNWKAVSWVSDTFQMMVCDESSAFKNNQSLTFSVLRRLSMKYRYPLSGMPFSSDPEGLWPQFLVSDGGETLGNTLGFYRECFFREEEIWAAKRRGVARVPTRWVLLKKKEVLLHRMLRHGSIRYETSECKDLPPVVGGIDDLMIRSVHMSSEQSRHAAALHDSLIEAVQAEEVPEAIYYQMRCVSSGFIPHGDTFIDFKSNPKLDALIQLIEELGGQKLIVFVHYQHTAELVRAALIKKKIKIAELHGKAKNKSAQLKRFEGAAQVLIASKGAAIGLNLQFCSRTVYFESPDDIATRRQSEKRTHRDGQKSTVYYYDFVVRGTYDFKILDALKANKRVLDVVIDGVSIDARRSKSIEV
jgi:SNF2 family DNA or RNA helicase